MTTLTETSSVPADVKDTKSFIRFFRPQLQMGRNDPTAALKQLRLTTNRDYQIYIGILFLLIAALVILAFKEPNSTVAKAILGSGSAMLGFVIYKAHSALQEKTRISMLTILMNGASEAQFSEILNILAKKL